MTVTKHLSATEIKLNIRNIPLAIFYLLVIVLIIAFTLFFESSLVLLMPVNILFVVVGVLILITHYFLIKSIFGKVVIKVSKEKMEMFEGVFGIGKRRALPTFGIEKIYVKKTVSNSAGGGLPYPAEVKQHLIIKGSSKVKLLHNQVSIHQMNEFCNELNVQLSIYQS